MKSSGNRVLAVGGEFPVKSFWNGRPSGYLTKFFAELRLHFPSMQCINGGKWEQLCELAANAHQYDIIFWFCDIDNSLPKLVSTIKAVNPKCLLITSKSNLEGKYDFGMLIAHALKNKSNLFVEFTRPHTHFAASVCDPLGNRFINTDCRIPLVVEVLATRVTELLHFTRVSSVCAGPKIDAPDDPEFFSLVRQYAEEFHELIHGVNHERMMGNMSFRCESGFPSMRKDNLIYVSRRNVDKRDIGPEACVAVQRQKYTVIKYYGADKPSVDTPVQVRLYKYYKNIRYMLHSHVYVDTAPMTDRIIPCGAIEEYYEIIYMFRNRMMNRFAVNLKGHGSIVFGATPADFEEIQYVARPAPEDHRYENKIREWTN